MSWFTKPIYSPLELTFWMFFAGFVTTCASSTAERIAIEAKP